MTHNIDDAPVVIMVPANVTAPVNDIPAAEWGALKDRVSNVENLGIADLSDVDLADLADARVLMWDEDAGAFVAGETVQGIDFVDGLFEPIADSATHIVTTPSRGIRAVPSGTAGYVYLEVIFGGTGSSSSVARFDHTHTQDVPLTDTTAPSGYMSGGSRTLGTVYPWLAPGRSYVVEAEVYGQLRGADPGAAYYTLELEIDGVSFTSPGGVDGFWCVQGVPDKYIWKFERKLVGTGTTRIVRARIHWHSGSGLNVDRSWVKARLRPER